MKLRSHRRTFVSKYPTSPRSQEEDKIRQHAKRFMRLPVYLMNEKRNLGIACEPIYRAINHITNIKEARNTPN